MGTIRNPAIRVFDNDPEIKAFIYQQIAEFEDYVTPETIVAVVARDPRKLALQLETDGKYVEPRRLRQMYRIAIVLKEDDTKIESEGLHEDLYEAIIIAKTMLLNQLREIHDKVMTQQDRIEQINFALSNQQLH